MGGGGELPLPGGPVVQAHDALDDGHVGPVRAVQEQRRDQVRGGEPGVQVAAGAARRQGVVAGVDVVGTHLVRRDRETPGREGGHQPGRDRRLTGTGRGRGNDQAAHHSMPFCPF